MTDATARLAEIAERQALVRSMPEFVTQLTVEYGQAATLWLDKYLSEDGGPARWLDMGAGQRSGMLWQAQIDYLIGIVAEAQAQLTAAQARSREDAELIEKMVVDAFDVGFSWARGLQGQNLEDSRAVGRTLQSYLFSEAGLTVDTDEWDSFTTADIAICEGKRRIKAALVTKLRARADELGGRTDG